MDNQKPFLTAFWHNLVMANYTVDAAVLQPYVPAGCILDDYNGKTYMSLVAFQFLETKVKGFKLPGHVNFPELNLRFYVRYPDGAGGYKRGVVFIRELVPRHLITFVANTLFKENYRTVNLQADVSAGDDKTRASYTFSQKGEKYLIAAEGSSELQQLEENSLEHFIAEHYWGYAAAGRHTVEYEVRHPPWYMYRLLSSRVEGDFAGYYGGELGSFLAGEPENVFFALGSAVEVFPGKKIRPS